MNRTFWSIFLIVLWGSLAEAKQGGCSAPDINSLPDIPEELSGHIDGSFSQFYGFFVYVPVCMTNISRQVESVEISCLATHIDNTQLESDSATAWRRTNNDGEYNARDVDTLILVEFQNYINNPLLVERIECSATFVTTYQRFTDWDTVDYCNEDVADAETVCAQEGTARNRVSNWIRGVD